MDACNLAVESAATSHEKVSLQNAHGGGSHPLITNAVIHTLGAKAAQGDDTSAKLAGEQKKFTGNIHLDKAGAGGHFFRRLHGLEACLEDSKVRRGTIHVSRENILGLR
ncbi:unnamed protein product [Diplocarpon coronariae]